MEETVNQNKKNGAMLPVIVLVAALLVLGGGYMAFKSMNSKASMNEEKQEIVTNTQEASPTEAMTAPSDAPAATEGAMKADSTATDKMAASTYKDGEYKAEGDYTSPGGPETIGVVLTVKNDVVTAAEVTPHATRPMSVKFQGLFTANFKPMVVGKKLSEIKLDKVSGSSLTPKGFNDAVTKIEAQAKA